MVESSVSSDVKSLWKWIGGSAFLASMCCIPSVVLVLFGLASVSSAAALSNDLYWGTNGMSWFRPALSVLSLVLVALGLVLYFRNDGICTLDEVRRQRKRIVNTSVIAVTLAVLIYVVFNFIILTEIGVALDLPWESSRLWN
ncbi:MAG: hypothetical protein QGI14_00075 [Candidatus Poseidonia sp.]|jgi:hypothetical protein|nr:hypothetical protein [Euryarchaeota archaeon]MDP7393570.1 hypothetical protein [Poseidonia sp.]MEC7089953.1 hypothetical protein [Candidatus Thermoplasmatota archaeon]DAC59627.1 MAG TPA: hypothetical protein D7I08_01875 [Candidatus Poseidoniales archaeon]|tara:strand:+ start:9661 stop:10086 length:426 start_codon:yes stop_codon:yes gene_type:complete